MLAMSRDDDVDHREEEVIVRSDSPSSNPAVKLTDSTLQVCDSLRQVRGDGDGVSLPRLPEEPGLRPLSSLGGGGGGHRSHSNQD